MKDRLSKYTHFLALSHPYTAKIVVAMFVKKIVHLHGFSSSIGSDQDKVFISFALSFSNYKAHGYIGGWHTTPTQMVKPRLS